MANIKKSTSVCNVPYCGHRKLITDCIFFKFPLDEAQCKKWVQIVGVESYAQVSIFKLNDLRKVCSCHFTADDYKSDLKKRLKRNAVPSIIDPRITPLSDTLLADFPPKKPDVIEEVIIHEALIFNGVFYEPSLKQHRSSDITAGVLDLQRIDDNRANSDDNQKKYRPSTATKNVTHKRLLEEAGFPGATRTPELDAVLSLLQDAYVAKKELMNELEKKKKLCDNLLSRLQSFPPPLESPLGMYTDSEFLAEIHNRHVNRKPRGERYSKKEMLFAVGVFERSRSCYRYLKDFIKMPNMRTIKRYRLRNKMQPEVKE